MAAWGTSGRDWHVIRVAQFLTTLPKSGIGGREYELEARAETGIPFPIRVAGKPRQPAGSRRLDNAVLPRSVSGTRPSGINPSPGRR